MFSNVVVARFLGRLNERTTRKILIEHILSISV